MNPAKTCFIGVLLLGSLLWGIRASAETEVWQDVWQEKGNTAAARTTSSVDWEQRALKRPQAARPTAQRWVSPRLAQRPSYDQTPMETIPAAGGIGDSDSNSKDTRGRSRVRRLSSRARPSLKRSPPAVFSATNPPGRSMAAASCGQGDGEGAGGCGDCGSCDGCAADGRCDFGWEVFDGCCGPFMRGLSVFGGVDGFKGPLDRGNANGNFGVNEGLNLARPLGDPWGCGYQIGANFVQSDFSGASVFTDNGLSLNAPFRKQYFATAGIFRRACGRGCQWGIAYDFLHDIYLRQRQFAANPQ